MSAPIDEAPSVRSELQVIAQPRPVAGQPACVACGCYHGPVGEELRCLRRALREARVALAAQHRAAR